MKSEYPQWTKGLDDLPAARLAIPGQNLGLVRLVLSHSGVLVIVDLALGLLAYFLAWLVSTNFSVPFTRDIIPEEQWMRVGHPWIVLSIGQVFLIYIFGLYDELRTTRFRELTAYLATVCLLQFPLTTSALFLADSPFPRKVLVLFELLNFVLLVTWRFYVKAQLKKHHRRVLIVGEGPESSREIIREIERSPWMGMTIIGLIFSREPAPGERAEDKYPILGALDRLDTVIMRYGIEEIILASQPSWKDNVLNSISRMQAETAVKINILPSAYEMVIGKLRHVNIHDTPLISVRRNPNEPFQRAVKRAFDLGFSALCLILLSPLLAVTAAAVYFSSGRPVLYRQERIGYAGRSFRLTKFRTMIPDAEKAGAEKMATVGDPRTTPLGKILRRFRLDELPQLFNVLRGDMSFVGPRPERPGFVKTFQETVPGYSERHKIKPGITGLAQVRGYYHTSAASKLKYDLAYIYNYSFSLDLFLLLETLKVVLTRRGS